ncbi:hypothetical protein BD626DRAFT_18712 [Schizophyllum amplum]|uniref:Uncharacterized protein n=1 Tax=Schizophyllum amplum TaxID=97359 RepID=A0A550CYC9_9AGAR|nr:hypothetical protein BD626DRAFT_18712 [Auriculariopsis ampla]
MSTTEGNSSSSVSSELSLGMVNWIEAAFYGIYATLFYQYMVSRFKHGIGTTVAARVYFAVTILMFLIGTAYSALSIYSTVVYSDADNLNNPSEMTSLATGMLAYIQMWLGDLLIAYRAHLVWDRNWRITALPWMLLLCTLVVLACAAGTGNIMEMSVALFLAVAQNIITTGLLVYRLVSQHTESVRAGLHRYSRRNGVLIRIAYIISESAAVYLTVLILYAVFFHIGHPAMSYMQVMLPSVTGIVLLTISARIAAMQTGSAGGSSLIWTPPSEWQTSVHIATGPLDSNSREDTILEEAERYIETRYPGIWIKEDSRRGSPAPSQGPDLLPMGAMQQSQYG